MRLCCPRYCKSRVTPCLCERKRGPSMSPRRMLSWLPSRVKSTHRCFGLYGIDDEDNRAIVEGFGHGAENSDQPIATDADGDDEGDTETSVDAASQAAELISWAIGVAFGRFDVRLATGARLLPVEPAPFRPTSCLFACHARGR